MQIRKVASEVANTLGEKDRKPYGQIAALVRMRGEDFIREVLADTLQIEAQGGMMTAKGDRRRTIGGVFFRLARERLTRNEGLLIFARGDVSKLKRAKSEAQFPAFTWDDRAEVIHNLKNQEQGEVSDVKIILQGHPKSTERRENLVILRMQHDLDKIPNMPRGVPDPGDKAMPYTVIVNSEQYETAEAAIQKDPKDELHIEGFAAYDAETSDIVVFATRAITRKIHKQERRRELETMVKQTQEAQQRKEIAKQKSDENRRKQLEANAKKKEQAAPSSAGEAVKPEGKNDVPFAPVRMGESARAERTIEEFSAEPPPHLDAEAAKKYADLLRAEATYRQRIADIEAKPEDQRFGLEMTLKLLTSIQKQIKALVDQTDE
ncbi:MAG: hypothetical protein EA396_05370 [Anaerolineaceae bacterium]|nr:MAG: hypothetical protein EA396_05370 [Anaerolineaceae bacterium]